MNNNPWDQFPTVETPQDDDPWAQFPVAEEAAPEAPTEPERQPSMFETIVENVSPLSPTNIGRAAKVAGAFAGGVNNAARNTALNGGNVFIEGARMAGDALSGMGVENLDYVPGFGYGQGNSTDAVGETEQLQQMPKYVADEDDTLEKIAVTAGEYAPGAIGGGMGVARALPAAVTNMGKLGRYLTTFLGSEAGGAMTIDPETETLLVGPDAEFKGAQDLPGGSLLTGLVYDKDGNYDETLFEKRMNIFMDAAIIGGAVGAAGGAGVQGARFAWDSIIAPVVYRNNPEYIMTNVVKQIHEKLANIDGMETAEEALRKRQEVIDLVEKHGNELVQTGDEALGNVELRRDTISALNEGLGPDADAARVSGLESLRAGARAGSSDKLEAAMNAPTDALSDTLDTVVESRGGRDAIQETAGAIQDAGEARVQVGRENILAAEERLARAKYVTAEELQEDPTFGPILKKLGERVNINLSGPSNEISGDMTERILRASDIMTEEKNKLYGAIPEGAMVNRDSINQSIEAASRYLDDDVIKMINETGMDFRKLYDFANLELQPMIQSAVAKNEFGEARALRALYKNITDDQLDFLANSNRSDVADAAKKARDYYRDEYAPFWRDNDTLADMQTIGRSGNPLAIADKAPKALRQGLDDGDSSAAINNTMDLLARDEAGRSEGLAVDYATSQIAKQVQTVLNRSNKFTPDDVAGITNSIDRWAPIFERAGKADELNKFMTRLNADKIDIKSLEKDVADLTQRARELEHEYLGDYLSDFFTNRGDFFSRKPNGLQSFKELFSNPQNHEKLGRVMAEIQGDETAMKGMQAAMADFLNDNLYNAGKTSTQSRVVNLDNLNNYLDGRNGLSGYADQIFGPELNQALRRISQTVYDINAPSKARLDSAVSDRQAGERAVQGVNTMITWMFGVLNPTAARLRTVTGQINKRLDPKQQVSAAIDMVLADPELFVREARNIMSSETAHVNPEFKKAVWRSLLRAGIYHERDEEAFMSADMNETVSRPSVDDETDDALGTRE